MTKIIEKKEKQYTKTKKNTPSLDKLAQLTPNLKNSGLEILTKRAKAKHFTNSYTKVLASLRSPLQKSYNNTIYGCCTSLIQQEDKITSKYCNNRWCIVCNRIRTAKMINEYYPILTELKDKHFVTLTVPNIPGVLLRWQIKDMIKKAQLIVKQIRKTKEVKGLRKLECTINLFTRHFHPHFHFVVEGEHIAKEIVKRWLKMNPEANIKAQDIRSADDGTMLELFKYFSKIISKDTIHVKSLDKIFISMRGLRVYQPLGIKKVSEDIEELQAEVFDVNKMEAIWNWLEHDWYNIDTGESLTNYKPSELILRLINNICL